MSTITQRERDKYERIWSVPDYRTMSPGEQWIPLFLDIVGSDRGTLLDAGAGTGRAGKALSDKGFAVTLVDHTASALEVDVKRCVSVSDVPCALLSDKPDGVVRFIETSLWDRESMLARDWGGDLVESPFDYGYCCDVMEHIPPEFTMLVVSNLLHACRRVFFSISTVPDVFGLKIGEPLHLTVQPFTWWRDRFMEIGDVIEARDMVSTSVFMVQR